MHVSVVQSISSGVISPCLISTTAERERRQGQGATPGGPFGVLRPLADASESANWDCKGGEIGGAGGLEPPPHFGNRGG